MTLKLISPLVSSTWLEQHLDHPALRILECTMVMQPKDDGSVAFVPGLSMWLENHIPNSRYVDVGGELSDPDGDLNMMMPPVDSLAETFRTMGIGDGTAVVCYDRGNHAWAARVWWLLKNCGFDNAAVLDGGWKKWQGESRPVSDQVIKWPDAQSFSVVPHPEMMADKERVKAVCENQDALLLHSLPLPMFTGEVNAYGRPGRIPGSKHLYCEALLDPVTNTYLDTDTLRARIAAAGISEDDAVITYCGGGIAASANALALTAAGYEKVAVYDGSLSEWAADLNLPMETDKSEAP